MENRYSCGNTGRRARLIDMIAGGGVTINAIDFVEIVDGVLDGVAAASDDPRQRILLIRFLQRLPKVDTLDRDNIRIKGGVTITDIKVGFAWRLDALPLPSAWSAIGENYLLARRAAIADLKEIESWLVVWVEQAGDHSVYELELVEGVASQATPADFDPILTKVDFRFKVECPSDFDCEDEVECPPNNASTPQLDYLARDYQSFRRLMLDRLSVLLPDWKERNPADLGITLVELLAYAADRAAYFQDAVATEAYLGTARLRTSVRRHARLLDYRVHEGCNARAWVQLQVLQLVEYPTRPALPSKARFLTKVPDAAIVIRSADEADALDYRPEVFESLHALESLNPAHNEIHLHTWGESSCVLARGATAAALRTATAGVKLTLVAGDVIVFEELRHPDTRAEADRDLNRRHAVRLSTVAQPQTDLLYGVEVWEVEWAEADALPFSLCLRDVEVDGKQLPVTVARGNVVLVDHGFTRTNETLVPDRVPDDGRYRPRLRREQLTWCVPYVEDEQRSRPATLRMIQDPRKAEPAVTLLDSDDKWEANLELLASDPFDREFVVEMENDSRAYLRFGDGVLGRKPSPEAELLATYRTGRGSVGNVGAESICHLVSNDLGGAVTIVRNPMPATGGQDPEPLQTVKLHAPQAFKVQMRAVTVEDWAEVAGRHSGVQRAVATIRWTGSWHTVFLTIDPVGRNGLDPELETDLYAFLEQFRLAGVDLELRPPTYVPIDFAFVVCVAQDRFAHEVKAELLELLGSRVGRTGSRGWFHPDRLSFGQDVRLSPIIAEVMKVPGVAWVDLDPVSNGSDAVRFQRYGKVPAGELEAGVLRVDRLEVARLDNNPSAPDNGRLRLTVRGGR